MKGIYFEHITDSRREGKNYDNIKTAIYEMHEKANARLYELQYVYNIEYSIGEPFLLNWGDNTTQYRYKIRIRKHKTNRKITRNQIYYIMNQIYVTVYKNI